MGVLLVARLPASSVPVYFRALDRFAQAAAAGRALILFRGALADDAGRTMIALADALASSDRAAARAHYGRLFALLADEVELGSRPPGDAWQVHLLERLLADENPFSRKCETAGLEAAGPALVAAAAAD